MIEWRLFEVKQHKYKFVLGWVTIWWVVLLQWFRRLTSVHNLVFLRLLLKNFRKLEYLVNDPLGVKGFHEILQGQKKR